MALPVRTRTLLLWSLSTLGAILSQNLWINNELLVLVLSAFSILTPALTILTSYIFILSSILQINSPEGRSKAFSTCSSHILAVAVFFGSAAFMYLQPSFVSSMDQGKVSSVFYTCLIPLPSPLIYSLQKKDVKFVLKKVLERGKCIWIESIAWGHRSPLVCLDKQCVRFTFQIFGNLLIRLYIIHLQNSPPGYFFEHTLQWLYKEIYNNKI